MKVRIQLSILSPSCGNHGERSHGHPPLSMLSCRTFHVQDCGLLLALVHPGQPTACNHAFIVDKSMFAV